MLSSNIKRDASILLTIKICVLRVAIEVESRTIRDINKRNKVARKICYLLKDD